MDIKAELEQVIARLDAQEKELTAARNEIAQLKGLIFPLLVKIESQPGDEREGDLIERACLLNGMQRRNLSAEARERNSIENGR